MYLEFETFERSAKPNNYLVAPDDVCRNSTPDTASPLFSKSADTLFGELIALFNAQKGWKHLNYDEENHQISVVAVTSLLRFKDDLDIRIYPASESPASDSCRIAVYSRSRIGHSDLGANQKRVAALIKQLQPSG